MRVLTPFGVPEDEVESDSGAEAATDHDRWGWQ